MAELKPDQAAPGLSLSRWSRLKRASRTEQALDSSVRPELREEFDEATAPAGEPENAAPAWNADRGGETQQSRASRSEDDALPPLSSISLAEDFTPFMQAKVPQALKQRALKALFKEPHFNLMDGLDIYIDDYTVFEPITPEVMATLSSWKSIMNPPQQIVTPQGYAVDVESDEGKAVLAARAKLVEADVLLAQTAGDELVPSPIARSDTHVALGSRAEGEGGEWGAPTSQTTDLTPTDEPRQLNDETNTTALTQTPEPKATSPSLRATGEGEKPHIRYGKRVGDFSPILVPAVDEPVADLTSASTVQATDTLSADTQKNSS